MAEEGIINFKTLFNDITQCIKITNELLSGRMLVLYKKGNERQ